MRIAITGHTSGLGKELSDHFISLGNDVLGISRSTGFDIINNQDDIVSAVDNFDLFINNTHHDNCQTELLNKLANKVKFIIVIGSAMHLFRDVATFEYLDQKFLLSQTCRNLNVNPSVNSKILHINISFLPPNLQDNPSRLKSDNAVQYSDLIKLIDHWISNPVFTDVTLQWKLTPIVIAGLEKKIPNLKIDLF